MGFAASLNEQELRHDGSIDAIQKDVAAEGLSEATCESFPEPFVRYALLRS
jgi:hypothetical protein